MSQFAHPRILAFAQLLRLPNVFTAFADIGMADAVACSVLPRADATLVLRMVVVALASGCLYLAGMVWNDVFDRGEDAQTRPTRPIPSGRVRLRTAVGLGAVLTIAGLMLAGIAGAIGVDGWEADTLVYAFAIAGMVLLYDGWLKHTPFGPIAMAACRFLNVLLGLAVVPEALFDVSLRVHTAGVIGLYIVGVTWFARTEEGVSRPMHLRLSAGVMATALLLSLLLRARITTMPGAFLYPYFLTAFGFYIGMPIERAIRFPHPKQVQAAVKRCVLGLVVLDSVLAVAFIGPGGLLVLLLLPPALQIGKWVYST